LDDFDGEELIPMIGSAIRSAVAITGEEATADGIIREIVVKVRSDLNRVIDSVSPGELAEAVDAAMNHLTDTIPVEFTDELFAIGAAT
jgi:hypothetical protein